MGCLHCCSASQMCLNLRAYWRDHRRALFQQRTGDTLRRSSAVYTCSAQIRENICVWWSHRFQNWATDLLSQKFTQLRVTWNIQHHLHKHALSVVRVTWSLFGYINGNKLNKWHNAKLLSFIWVMQHFFFYTKFFLKPEKWSSQALFWLAFWHGW